MASRPRFRWDGRRYRDTVSGRYVSSREVRAAIDTALRRDSQSIRTLAGDLRAGRISRAEWSLKMRETVRSIHIYSGVAARGGWAAMEGNHAAWGQIGAAVREQQRFLDGFIAEVEAGTVPLDGRFTRRAEMYAQAGRATFHKAEQRVQQGSGMTHYRNVLAAEAEHCTGADSCIAMTDAGWQPIGTLLEIGSRLCLTADKCRWEYTDAPPAVAGTQTTLRQDQQPSLASAPTKPSPPAPVEWLEGDEAEAMLQSLRVEDVSEAELASVSAYQSPDYFEMNALLRGTPGSGWVKAISPEQAGRLNSDLRSLFARTQGADGFVTFRAIENADALLGGTPLKMVGGIIEDRGFMSTTLDREQAERWGNILANRLAKDSHIALVELRVPGGTKALLPGAYVDQSKQTVKREVVLGPGQKLRIVSITEKTTERSFQTQFGKPADTFQQHTYHIIAEIVS